MVMWPGKMAQRGKGLAAKPGTHMVDRENKLSSDLHTCALCSHIYMHIHTCIIYIHVIKVENVVMRHTVTRAE